MQRAFLCAAYVRDSTGDWETNKSLLRADSLLDKWNKTDLAGNLRHRIVSFRCVVCCQLVVEEEESSRLYCAEHGSCFVAARPAVVDYWKVQIVAEFWSANQGLSLCCLLLEVAFE